MLRRDAQPLRVTGQGDAEQFAFDGSDVLHAHLPGGSDDDGGVGLGDLAAAESVVHGG